MGFRFILGGMFFLINPNIHTLDILPDSIGLLLIVVGLYKMADLVYSLAEARRSFLSLFIFELIKIPVSIFSLFVSKDESTWLLIFTLSFSILEVLFLMSAFNSMFDGLIHLSMRGDKQLSTVNTSDARIMTPIFLIVKSLLTVLPEFSSLYLFSDNAPGYITATNNFNLYDYKGILIILNVIAVLVLGIIWFNIMSRLIRKFDQNKSLLTYLTTQYEKEILPNTGLFIRRRIYLCACLGIVACIFLLDLVLDHVNIIPDFLFGIFVVVTACFLKKYSKKAIPLIISSSLFTIVNTIFFVVSVYYSLYAGTKKGNAFYPNVCIAAGISSIVLVVVIIFAWLAVKDTADRYCGYYPDVNETEHTAQKLHYIRRKIKRNIRTTFILSIVYTFSGFITVLTHQSHPSYWIIHMAFGVLWLYIVFKTLSDISDRVAYHYM